jgi:long-chain acyl-CoA synthetase
VFPGVEVKIAPDGEILVRGPNVFQGYWQNPGATATTLVDGWYHTGDLGMLDDEGYLVLKGRKKDLIVLANGQNVYPEDIENELKQHPAVIEGVVLGLEKLGGVVEVHAVLLMHDPNEAENAVAFANSRLADHQRIQGYTVWPLEDFPRTHTLKVKKREVLDMLNDVKSSDEEIPAPAATPTTDNAVHRLIGEVGSMSVAEIRPESTLGGDLNLDSLGRVELLSAIEGEIGAYVDEAGVTPETTVAELEALVAAAQQRGAGTPFASWPLTPVAGVAREAFLQVLLFPSYHLFWRVRVVGRERLKGVPQPLIVAANHHFGWRSYGYDPAAAWMALPRELRRRICTAGEEHSVFDNRVKGFMAHLVNAFPLSKEGNVRGSLEYIGRLLDLNWSILIFPEGILTIDGPAQPFMGGTGLVAVEANAPVVPVWIDVERKSLLQGSRWPLRGAFTVYIGSPLTFQPGTSYVEATGLIEQAVVALDPHRFRNGAAPNLADVVSALPGQPNGTGAANTQPEAGRLPTGA